MLHPSTLSSTLEVFPDHSGKYRDEIEVGRRQLETQSEYIIPCSALLPRDQPPPLQFLLRPASASFVFFYSLNNGIFLKEFEFDPDPFSCN
ncbi:unnamed protein product [Brassica oleracea]